MIPRIKSITPVDDYHLLAVFDDGTKVEYDVNEDINAIEAFADLKSIPGLFATARLDESRTCIVWNEFIDLPSDTVLEYGVVIE